MKLHNIFLGLLFVSSLLSFQSVTQQKLGQHSSAEGFPRQRHNVVVILVDDVGVDQLASYDDVNLYTDPEGYAYGYTPNLDNMAANGVRYTQFRTNPLCSPTRASLLSGFYSFRHGAGTLVTKANQSATFHEFDLSPSPQHQLLPELIPYATATIGKWHLGFQPPQGGTMDDHPNLIGITEWMGTPKNIGAGGPGTTLGITPGYYNFFWVENGIRTQVLNKSNSELIADKAVDWIGNHSDEPFFLYVPFNACHVPVKDSDWPRDNHGFGVTPPTGNGKSTRWRAMLEHMDYHIGRIVNSVDDNTIVMVVGDNGTAVEAFEIDSDDVRYPAGHPLHSGISHLTQIDTSPYDSAKVKATMYEGGIKAPLIVYAPGLIAGGKVRDDLVDIVDIFPTVLTLMSVKTPSNRPGFDFSKSFLKNKSSKRDYSFSQLFGPNGLKPLGGSDFEWNAYIRKSSSGLWKIIELQYSGTGTFEFYNVLTDPLETNDLTASHPEYQATLDEYLAFIQ